MKKTPNLTWSEICVIIILTACIVCVATIMVYDNALPVTTPEPVQTVEAEVIQETPQAKETTPICVHPLAAEIFALTNQVRMQNGVHRLDYANELQEAADTRAYECSIQFSHTRPNGSSCHDIVTVDYWVTGENLLLVDKAIAYPEVMMSEWMNSPDHRENILLSDFERLAVGIYETQDVIYACQIFIG